MYKNVKEQNQSQSRKDKIYDAISLKNKNDRLILVALFLLIIGRWVLQVMLYRSGFEALTADEFGRTVQAARWVKEPYMVWSGPWLPFHLYLHGLALSIHWDLLNLPRGVAMGIGFISLVLMYLFSYHLLESRQMALVSAILLAVNPVHIWLSSTSLTELPQFTIVLAAMLTCVLYLKRGNIRFAYVGALLMALANGFRFEAWMMSIVFSLYFISQAASHLLYKQHDKKRILALVVIAILPWLFPIMWLVGNYLEKGDILYFKTAATRHKSVFYGVDHSYLYYWQTFIKIDPYTSFLAIFALIVGSWQKRSRPFLLYVAMTTIPFLIFTYLHGGQVEPPGNNLRYLAPFLFWTYPAVAFLLVSGLQKISLVPFAQNGLLILLTSTIILSQTNTTFEFTNDPATQGLKAGQHIAALRQSDPKLAQRPVLIEVAYWHYLAFHVGANDMSLILYDRIPDPVERKSESLFLTNVEAVSSCLYEYDVSYIIIRSPELIDIVENNLGLRLAESVHEWRFYPLPSTFGKNQGSCTLSFGQAIPPQ